MLLPEEYIIQKFLAHNGGVKYLKYQNAYQGSCCLCREGNSWLKKKRCYYLVDENVICCHNCGWYGKPLYWIKEVTHQSIGEIFKESKDFEFIPREARSEARDEDQPTKKPIIEALPHDPINLFDSHQLVFYRDNIVVKDMLQFISQRCLHKAIYKPKALYVSLTDKVHQNRLILPFYGDENDVLFYQTRAVYPEDVAEKGKYISKIGGEKSLFNYDKVDGDFDTLFILEGPINAFFCKNGIAVAGIQEKSHQHFTPTQQRQLMKFPLHRRIWVLDSQWIDSASYKKTKILIDQGHTVFIWPKALGQKYKDFNDVAVALGLKLIDPGFIISQSFSGLNAKLKMAEITNVKI